MSKKQLIIITCVVVGTILVAFGAAAMFLIMIFNRDTSNSASVVTAAPAPSAVTVAATPGTQPTTKHLKDFTVNDEGFVLYDGKSRVFHPKTHDFMVLGSSYRGGGTIKFWVAYLPEEYQDPATLAPASDSAGPESANETRTERIINKGRKLIVEVVGAGRETDKLFRDCIAGKVQWFRLDDVIRKGDITYYTHHISGGHGVMVMKIKYPFDAVFCSDAVEDYPVGGFGDIIPSYLISAEQARTRVGETLSDLFPTITPTRPVPAPERGNAGGDVSRQRQLQQPANPVPRQERTVSPPPAVNQPGRQG